MNDSYWMFDIIIPLMMIVLGYVFFKYTPKTINYILGYRTKRSMSSQENWTYANKRMGKIWFKWGFILLILVLLIRLFLPLNTETLVEINMYLGLAFIILPIFVIEGELKNMRKDSGLSLIKKKSDVKVFWDLFDDYIEELSENATFGDEFDLDSFYSKEYRDSLEQLRTNSTDPLKIFFIKQEGLNIGFLIYITYFDRERKSLLMEYYIQPKYRNAGYGKSIYFEAEEEMKSEDAKYIELTATNEDNERFWKGVGFEKTEDKDEDNKYIYRKHFNDIKY